MRFPNWRLDNCMEEGSFLLWPSPALCDARQRTGTVVVTGTRGHGAEASDGEKR